MQSPLVCDVSLSTVFPLTRITGETMLQRRWELLAVTSIAMFLTPLQGAIVAVALPVMGQDLHLSFSTAIWVQAAYLLTTAVLLIPVGRFADAYGRVEFYLAGLVIFSVGSLLCGLSGGALSLILSRIVQGIGSAFMFVTPTAIVTAAFPPQERGRALGVNVTAVYVGLSVGPPLGGLLVDAFGWRWVFFISLPFGLFALLWGWLVLPLHERTGHRLKPDYAGSVLFGAFLICLLIPLTFSPEWGWSVRTITLLALAVLSLAAFVVIELRVDDPVLDLNLVLRNRLFAAANFAALLNYMALSAIGLLVAVFLEVVQGRSAGQTGWIMLAAPVMQVLLSPPAGHLSDRVGSRLLTTGGMLIMAIGMVMLALMPPDVGVAPVMGGLALTGVGLAAFSAPNTSAVMGIVRRSQLAQASAFLSMMRTAGQALSVAILGGIAAAQLGALGGRVLLTRHVTGALGRQAVDNFVHGFRLAMLTGVGLAVVGAAVSLTRGPRDLEPATGRRPGTAAHAGRPPARAGVGARPDAGIGEGRAETPAAADVERDASPLL